MDIIIAIILLVIVLYIAHLRKKKLQIIQKEEQKSNTKDNFK